MYQAMADALDAAREDAAVRAVLITGQPGIFTRATTSKDFMARPPARAAMRSTRRVARFMRALLECDKPVVAGSQPGRPSASAPTMLLHLRSRLRGPTMRGWPMPLVSLGLGAGVRLEPVLAAAE